MAPKLRLLSTQQKTVCVKADVCERLVALKSRSNWHSMESSALKKIRNFPPGRCNIVLFTDCSLGFRRRWLWDVWPQARKP